MDNKDKIGQTTEYTDNSGHLVTETILEDSTDLLNKHKKSNMGKIPLKDRITPNNNINQDIQNSNTNNEDSNTILEPDSEIQENKRDSSGVVIQGKGKAGFQPGISGNPGGKPKGRTVASYIRELGKKKINVEGKEKREARNKLLAEKYWKDALGGSKAAMETILERTDGKVVEKKEIALSKLSDKLPVHEEQSIIAEYTVQ
jgi:hypothetical protein